MKLNLADNQITSKMAEQFFDSLSLVPNLTFLDLSENSLDDAAAPNVADLLLVSVDSKYSFSYLSHFLRTRFVCSIFNKQTSIKRIVYRVSK